MKILLDQVSGYYNYKCMFPLFNPTQTALTLKSMGAACGCFRITFCSMYHQKYSPECPRYIEICKFPGISHFCHQLPCYCEQKTLLKGALCNILCCLFFQKSMRVHIHVIIGMLRLVNNPTRSHQQRIVDLFMHLKCKAGRAVPLTVVHLLTAAIDRRQ